MLVTLGAIKLISLYKQLMVADGNHYYLQVGCETPYTLYEVA